MESENTTVYLQCKYHVKLRAAGRLVTEGAYFRWQRLSI